MSYQRRDPFYRRAKATGYRARSAFKLLELDDRYRLFARGDHVADIGAWPGAWMQVSLERVGPSGRVVGVDLVAIDPFPAENALGRQLDVLDPVAWGKIREALGRPADVVLCDLAPKLTGVRARDEAAAGALFQAVVAGLPQVLRPRGRLLIKLFMNTEYQGHLEKIGSWFADISCTRPSATRRGSAELYVIGVGFRSAR